MKNDSPKPTDVWQEPVLTFSDKLTTLISSLFGFVYLRVRLTPEKWDSSVVKYPIGF